MIPEWKETMSMEFNAIQKNDTWELITWIPSDNIINSMWVFKVKQKVDGIVEHLKAHLVANGRVVTTWRGKVQRDI